MKRPAWGERVVMWVRVARSVPMLKPHKIGSILVFSGYIKTADRSDRNSVYDYAQGSREATKRSVG